MPTLYYSPRSCSLVVHAALREAGLDFALVEVSTSRGEHLQKDYLAINPVGRIPSLRLDSGEVLTQVAALLTWVSAQVPDARLLPSMGPQHVRAVEWFAFLAGDVHPSFAAFFNPRRFTADHATAEQLKREGRERYLQLLEIIDSRLAENGTTLGSFSLVDIYAAAFHLWGAFLGLPVFELERYTRLARGVLSRPSARAAVEREGFELPAQYSS